MNVSLIFFFNFFNFFTFFFQYKI